MGDLNPRSVGLQIHSWSWRLAMAVTWLKVPLGPRQALTPVWSFKQNTVLPVMQKYPPSHYHSSPGFSDLSFWSLLPLFSEQVPNSKHSDGAFPRSGRNRMKGWGWFLSLAEPSHLYSGVADACPGSALNLSESWSPNWKAGPGWCFSNLGHHNSQ